VSVVMLTGLPLMSVPVSVTVWPPRPLSVGSKLPLLS
jgi:hypothetical protein